MADHRFGRGDREPSHLSGKNGGHGHVFHPVVLGRSGAMGVDVFDLRRVDTGIGDGVRHAGDDRLAVGAGPGAMKRVGRIAACLEHAEMLAPRALADSRLSMMSAPAPSPMTKPSRSVKTASVRRPRDRFASKGRDNKENRMRVSGLTEPSVPDAQRGLGLAAADGIGAELDRGRARGTSRGHRNRNALGPEALGEIIGDRADGSAVDRLEPAGRGGGEQIVVGKRVALASRLPGPRDAATRVPPVRDPGTGGPENLPGCRSPPGSRLRGRRVPQAAPTDRNRRRIFRARSSVPAMLVRSPPVSNREISRMPVHPCSAWPSSRFCRGRAP